MPYTMGNFTDSLVVIYDSENNYITKTVITAHNKLGMLIEVAEGLANVRLGTRLNLMIIHADGVSEFGGILKSWHSDIFEIGLFNERSRRKRSATRHTPNISAVIHSMIVGTTQEMLRSPMNVTIENMSTTGVLIRSPLAQLPVGAILQIELKISGRSVVLHGKVLREQENDDTSFGYGCKLMFLK